MSYNSPEKLKLLVLLTKYNHHHPDDKILSRLTESLTDQDTEMVKEYLAQEAALRAQYPYTDIQKQAQELQTLLDEVVDLTHLISYAEFKWGLLLEVMNDMSKLVEERKSEMEIAIREINLTHLRNVNKRLAAELVEQELKREANGESWRRPENYELGRKRRVDWVVEQPKADLVLGDQRPEKLYEKIDKLVHSDEAVETKGGSVELPEETNAQAKQPASSKEADLKDESALKIIKTHSPESLTSNSRAEDQLTAPFEQALPLLPRQETSNKQTPTIKPPIKPLRPALVRIKSKDGPKKRVSFSGTSDESSRSSYGMAAPISDMNTLTASCIRQQSTQHPASGLVVENAALPEEESPRRRSGTEPESHQAKLDKARYEAERIASEVRKFSWDD
ncbi:hypothetical protein VTL71DRAFT_8633 [Oculimacula yallundae]|uniref:Uncharacterized protein n=1 Tax=Oculimacula yallundae TaxID=86028 RepID=A0ABR4D0J6_9HELO